MVLMCKEFRSGVIKGVDESLSIFFKEENLKKNQIISVTYSVNSLGTYALVVYEMSKKLRTKKLKKKSR